MPAESIEGDREDDTNAISFGHFQTRGIPILAGRDFDARDLPSARRAYERQRWRVGLHGLQILGG